MAINRIAWLVTVLVALLTALLLLISGYTGYAGLGLAVARSRRADQPALAPGLQPASSARAARPRWLIASFSASLSSRHRAPRRIVVGTKAGS